MHPIEEEDTVKDKKRFRLADHGPTITWIVMLIFAFLAGVICGIDDQRMKIEGIIEAYDRVNDVRLHVEAERDACQENWNQFIQQKNSPYEETL